MRKYEIKYRAKSKNKANYLKLNAINIVAAEESFRKTFPDYEIRLIREVRE